MMLLKLSVIDTWSWWRVMLPLGLFVGFNVTNIVVAFVYLSSIKWNNAPSISSNLGSFSVRGSSVTEYIVDITPYVQNEQSGDGYISIVLKDDSKTRGKLAFNSKESGSDIAFLEIEYEVAANPISHH